MEEIKNIALVAHDNRKKDLIEWIEWNYTSLIEHKLICTGTTGKMVEQALKKKLEKDDIDLHITKLISGPLGGDQQLGAMIAFLWDPMQPQPHDVDVKALLRIAVLYNVPTACNRATADFLISSSMIGQDYTPVTKNYESYIKRDVNLG
jgi:methylglyoxal synthase